MSRSTKEVKTHTYISWSRVRDLKKGEKRKKGELQFFSTFLCAYLFLFSDRLTHTHIERERERERDYERVKTRKVKVREKTLWTAFRMRR